VPRKSNAKPRAAAKDGLRKERPSAGERAATASGNRTPVAPASEKGKSKPEKPARPGKSAANAARRVSTRATTGSAGKVAGKQPDGTLPTTEQLLQFVSEQPGKVGKREIARAFGLKGGARVALKRMLGELSEKGLISGNRRELRRPGTLPPVAVLDIIATDPDGDLIAAPKVWKDEEGPRPRVRLLATSESPVASRQLSSLGIGDTILARISLAEADDEGDIGHLGELIRRLPRETTRLLGIYRANAMRPGGHIEPIDKKNLRTYTVQKSDAGQAADGDLVRFEMLRKNRQHVPSARVLEAIGNPDDQRQISLIAVHAHGLKDEFPEGVIAELDDLPKLDNRNRTDLTGIPLLTIDPSDARDHDDAVFAEPDTSPGNSGGFHIIVAIADVAHYVRPDTRLDREAAMRANSVYFPDRVVPMLPEKISNDLCSLREHEERPCIAVRITFDKSGTKRSHEFMRALMRSAVKLSYQEAQAAFDGDPGERAAPFLATALKPLLDAYGKLAAARERRQPLDLDLPERKLRLDENGQVAEVVIPERLEAHRLIEEFMIQANVAAAEELEKRTAPVVYRVHDKPTQEKLKSVRDFLATLDLSIALQGRIKPEIFNKVLAKAKDLPVPELVNEIVLRAQAQAEYTPENVGHFGLNLSKYAHFTSPIRRYADLLVHRALITALDLGEGGLPEQLMALDPEQRLAELGRICKSISEAERRAMAAERETTDRLISAHLADRIGAKFAARIGGVTRAGLFVRLDDTGADGFVPISSLGDEYFTHVEEAHALVGDRSGLAYRLGDRVEVKLIEAIPSAGALRFEMLSEGKKGQLTSIKGGRVGKPGGRGRKGPSRRPGRGSRGR